MERQTNGQVLSKVLLDYFGDRVYGPEHLGYDIFGVRRFDVDFVIDRCVPVKCFRLRPSKSLTSYIVSEDEFLHHVVSMIRLINKSKVLSKGYFVLSGESMTEACREFIRNQGHREYLKDGDLVDLWELSNFISRVMKGDL